MNMSMSMNIIMNIIMNMSMNTVIITITIIMTAKERLRNTASVRSYIMRAGPSRSINLIGSARKSGRRA